MAKTEKVAFILEQVRVSRRDIGWIEPPRTPGVNEETVLQMYGWVCVHSCVLQCHCIRRASSPLVTSEHPHVAIGVKI